MDSTARLLYIAGDVRAALTNAGVDFGEDLSRNFEQDLQLTLGGFCTLLTLIQRRINNNANLPLLRPLVWSKLRGNDATGQTFAEYYFERRIVDLIRALDWVVTHSPYEV